MLITQDIVTILAAAKAASSDENHNRREKFDSLPGPSTALEVQAAITRYCGKGV